MQRWMHLSPRLVAYNEPNMPPKEAVRYRVPNALPRLLACVQQLLLVSQFSAHEGSSSLMVRQNSCRIQSALLMSHCAAYNYI